VISIGRLDYVTVKRHKVSTIFSTLLCIALNATVKDWSSPIELVHRQRFRTRVHAKAVIFEYIEVFYNRQRRHFGIGYQHPIQAFEDMTWKMAA